MQAMASLNLLLSANAGIMSLISLIIVIVGIIVPIWYTTIRKNLLLQLVSNKQILNVTDPNIQNKISVTHQSIPVNNPFLIEIQLRNTGNKAIEENDFRTDLLVDFSGKISVLEATLIFNDADYTIPVNTINNGNTISIPPFLLNQKESCLIKIIANSLDALKNDDVNINGRISGIQIKKLNSITDSQNLKRTIFTGLHISQLSLLVLCFAALSLNKLIPQVNSSVAVLSLFISIMLTPFTFLFAIEYFKKR